MLLIIDRKLKLFTGVYMSKSFVKVQFKNDYANDYAGKEYEFGTYEKLEVGDFVVVDTANGLGIAKVSQIDTAGGNSYKLVVCKVDLKQHKERVEKELRKAEIEAKMKARLEESVKLETYKKIAESDPEMKELLSEFESLD